MGCSHCKRKVPINKIVAGLLVSIVCVVCGNQITQYVVGTTNEQVWEFPPHIVTSTAADTALTSGDGILRGYDTFDKFLMQKPSPPPNDISRQGQYNRNTAEIKKVTGTENGDR